MEPGWLSLLPPIVAIGLAIATRRVVISLLIGILVGAFLVGLSDHDPLEAVRLAVVNTCGKYLWNSLKSLDHLQVFAFTLMMGVMIAVISRSGGMQGVVNWLAPFARGRRGGQLVTWLMGLVIFIDDYANSLLLGNTMRPVTDRLRISREKLAYLVDSTAAPVSGLALISTWIAGEIGFIEAGFTKNGVQVDGFGIFIESIPYRFYVLWALLFVPIVAILGRDFGPMLIAERKTLKHGPPPDSAEHDKSHKSRKPRAMNAVLPIVITIVVTFSLLYVTGWRELTKAKPADVGVLPQPSTGPWRGLMNTIGAGNSYVALFYGSMSGLVSAVLLVAAQRMMSLSDFGKTVGRGAVSVVGALAILWAAWALSDLSQDDLKTGEFLGGLLKHASSPAWMPTIVFVLASIVAFSTGTSWGTMGLIMPLVIQAMADMSGLGPHDPLMLAVVGSVLAGAIFGDHCSPISDTTVLSSQASGCHHVAHVRTQMPYALLVGAVSILCGTLPVGFGVSAWLMLPIGLVALALLMRVFGQRVE